MKLKIGINLLFLLPGVVGGTESNAKGLLRALSNLDNNNKYIIFVNRESYNLELLSRSNFNIVRIPVPARFRVFRYFTEQTILPALARYYNLDLLHSLGYVQPLILPCSSVVTIHDLNYLNLGSYMSKMKKLTLKFFIKNSANTSNRIITVSEFSKNQISSEFNLSKNKITVTHNAVDPIKKFASFQKISKKYDIHKPYVFGLSSKSPHKNIDNLLKAFHKIIKRSSRDLKLVLSGHLPSGGGLDLKKLARQHDIDEEVVFTGYVEDEELASLYSNAELFVFPSLYEGFGIPVLEAISYGTPVACSNVASLPEVAGDGALFFDPKDIEEIATAIDRILNNDNLKVNLVKEGKDNLTNFSWKESARKTLEVYEEVCC